MVRLHLFGVSAGTVESFRFLGLSAFLDRLLYAYSRASLIRLALSPIVPIFLNLRNFILPATSILPYSHWFRADLASCALL